MAEKSYSIGVQQKIDDRFIQKSLEESFIFKIDFKKSHHRHRKSSNQTKKSTNVEIKTDNNSEKSPEKKHRHKKEKSSEGLKNPIETANKTGDDHDKSTENELNTEKTPELPKILNETTETNEESPSKSTEKKHRRKHEKSTDVVKNSTENEGKTEEKSPEKIHRHRHEKSSDKHKNTAEESPEKSPEKKKRHRHEKSSDNIKIPTETVENTEESPEKSTDSKHKLKNENSSHHSRSKSDETYIQIDGHKLFLQNSVSSSSKSCPKGFSKFNFTITVSSPLINDYFLQRFAPAFLHIQKIENSKEIINLKVNETVIITENNQVDAVLVISPRKQCQLNFNLYNQPINGENVAGNGQFQPTKHRHQKLIGTAMYQFLPKRVRKISIGTINITVETLDPAEKYGTPAVPLEEDAEPESGEPPNSKFYRWIVSTAKTADGVKFCKILSDFIDEINKDMTTYKKAVKQNFDIITGFHITTPDEDLYVIETRATEPKRTSILISQILNDSPKSIHITSNTSISYQSPRLFRRLASCFPTITIPISIAELVTIEGLYFRKSDFSSLFSVSQKIFDLFSITDCGLECFYPTYRELRELTKRANELYLAPISKGIKIRPPTTTHSKSYDRRNILVDKNTKTTESREVALKCSENFKFEEKNTIQSPEIIKPERNKLIFTCKKRTPSIKDHFPISQPPMSVSSNPRLSSRRNKN